LAWTIEFSQTARRQIRRIDKLWQLRILQYLDAKVARRADPRSLGKPLRGDKHGFWRYRVGDYRIICQIEDNTLVILVVTLGHRGKVYD
jgi:mRNA interferase RelE/StbE